MRCAAHRVADALVRRPHRCGGDEAPGRRAAPAADHDLAGHRLLADDAAILGGDRGLQADLLPVLLDQLHAVNGLRITGNAGDDQLQRLAIGPRAEFAVRPHLHACFIQQSRGLLGIVVGVGLLPLGVDGLALAGLEFGAFGAERRLARLGQAEAHHFIDAVAVDGVGERLAELLIVHQIHDALVGVVVVEDDPGPRVVAAVPHHRAGSRPSSRFPSAPTRS